MMRTQKIIDDGQNIPVQQEGHLIPNDDYLVGIIEEQKENYIYLIRRERKGAHKLNKNNKFGVFINEGGTWCHAIGKRTKFDVIRKEINITFLFIQQSREKCMWRKDK